MPHPTASPDTPSPAAEPNEHRVYPGGWVRPYLLRVASDLPGERPWDGPAYDTFDEALTVVRNMNHGRDPVAWIEDLRLGRGATVYHYELHAAHTGNGEGWDLEEWHVDQAWGEPAPPEVASDAVRHRGYLRGYRQVVVWTRRLPMSSKRCPDCPEAS